MLPLLRSLHALPRFANSSLLRSCLVRVGCARGVKIIRKDLMAPLLGELTTMKIDNDQFRSVISPEMKVLEELFVKKGFEIRIAGGAVRDLLMGDIPHDFDFATTATPDEMKRMFTDEGIRMVNAGGEKHGTITARINDKENFEVTTLRIDVVTDGRHAEVQFTTDWQTDANRRDLTVNAMFLSFDGTVYDYFKGIEHLKQRKVLFVGDTALRIQEDYLRILRYFRFYGRLSLNENSHDADTLEAIRLNTDGLGAVSGERLAVEFRKILEGPFHCSLICLMHELGVTPYLGLPASPDLAEFRKVCQISEKLKPQGMTRLAALLRSEDDVLELHGRLRLSNAERDLLQFLVRYRQDAPKGSTDEDLLFCQTLQFTGGIKGGSTPVDRQWTDELLKYHGNEVLLQAFREWELPRFPITGYKLIGSGVRKGPQVGRVMTRMRQMWFESGFLLNEKQLMSKLKEIIEEDRPK